MADKNYQLAFKMSDGSTKTVNFTAPQGPTGATGQRGTGILKITTAPSSYTTATGGFTPTYRASLSTVKTQSNVSSVLVGDVIQYNYYQYPVGYVDSSYVYLGARTSIRGSTGAAGTNGTDGADGYTPVKGVDYFTPADQEAIVQQVIAALGTPVFGTVDENKHITLSGHLADGTYTLSFEDTDGFTAELCQMVKAPEPTSGTIPTVWNVGYTIDGDTGVVSQTSFTWGNSGVVHASDPIELQSGRTYRLTTENARYTIVMAYYYKADGTYISRETVWDTRSATIVSAQNIALNLPANTGLVRFRATGSTTTDQTSEIITTVKPVVAWEVSE